MNLSDPVAALEIGTSRTMLAIGEPLGPGRVKVAAKDYIPSMGVRKSRIVDMEQTAMSIESLVKHLGRESGYAIGQACLAMTGPHVQTKRLVSQCDVASGVVTENDMAEVYNRSCATGLDPNDRTLLDLSEVGYALDGMHGLKSPKGMTGRILELHTLAVHGSAARLADARAVASRSKFEIPEAYFAGSCAAAAVLTPQQKNAGAIVIDLGGGTTSAVAYADGHLLHAFALGVGGDHVTNDICQAFSISKVQAEALKISHASATLEPNGAERVPVSAATPGFGAEDISRRALDVVVNARLHETFSILLAEFDREEVLHHVNAGVVLTGNGARMKNVAALAQSVFGMPAQIGTIVPEIEGLETEEFPAGFATIAGTLLMAMRDTEQQTFLGSIFGNFKGLFKK